MSEEIELRDVLTAEELQDRWPGVLESELAAMVKDKTLPAFWRRKKLRHPEGGAIVHICVAGGEPYAHSFGEDEYFDWSDTVFKLSDVESLENDNPKFKWQLVKEQEEKELSKQNEVTEEWINCDSLASRWGWSPFDVHSMLHKGEIRFLRHFGQIGAPDVDNLNDASVHVVDLIRWEAKNAHRINNAPVLAEDGERLRQEIRSLTQKIAELEAGKAALQLELEARPIIPPKPPEPPKPPRTAAASKAATEKRVEEWKRHAACMVKVAVECCAQGPRKRKRPELRTLAKKHGGELPDVALDTLRDALPEEHVSRDAGPPRQD